MQLKPDAVLTWVLVVCALTVTVLVVRREIFTSPAASTQEKPKFVQNWRPHLQQGVRIAR